MSVGWTVALVLAAVLSGPGAAIGSQEGAAGAAPTDAALRGTGAPAAMGRVGEKRSATGRAAATVPTAAPAAEDGLRDALLSWIRGHRARILAELKEFTALPNVSREPEQILVNAAALRRMFEERGAQTRLLPSSGSPYVYARLAPEAPPEGEAVLTVLFYCHYDGQPVDPARWTTTAPFTPKLVGDPEDPEARLYGRSASDDKGPIIALLAAIDALRAIGLPPGVEAKFILDPEEEIGSPHLEEILEGHAALLAANLLVFADGPVHQSGRSTVVFGSRGLVAATLTLYGPAEPLHSGHYGNWAPNPAEKLAALLATMKDAHGRVLVEGFYDDVRPLSPAELAALAEIPPVEGALQERLLIARPDGGGKSLQELINLPSLNVRGLSSAWIGSQVRTIVPSTATAEIDLRLVTDVDPGDQVERLKAHVRRQGYHVVENEPDPATRRAHADVALITHGRGTPAFRTSMDTPLSAAVITAVRRAAGEPPVLMPTLGGTVPMSRFQRVLELPVYGVPVVNPDNSQHSPDENLRLGNLWEAIVVYASLLRLPAP
jgi:acetylornithine deacetylase/succinyl-diaminopimelate desuccinylase-like protein